MVYREPEAVRAKLQEGQLAIHVLQHEVTIYVPHEMMRSFTRGRIKQMARDIYGPSLVSTALIESWPWEYSVSFRLPLLAETAGQDDRLQSMLRQIQMAYDGIKGKVPAESESAIVPGPKKPARARKPEPTTEPKPPEPLVPLDSPLVLSPKPASSPSTPRPKRTKPAPVVMDPDAKKIKFVTNFLGKHTDLLVDRDVVEKIGLKEIYQLSEQVYGIHAIRPFSRNPLKLKDKFLVLTLPPAPKGKDKPQDPRVEELKKLLLAAYHRQ